MSPHPEFATQLKKEIPFYPTRHCVRPGMAGWGLVKQGYGASKKDALPKLQLELVILLETIVDILTPRGR